MKTSEVKRAAAKRYYHSEAGKAARERYKASGARKAWQAKFRKSAKGKAHQARNGASEKRKEYVRLYRKTTIGKAVLARASKTLHEKRRAILCAEKLKLGCIDCGYNKHHAALDFDHIRWQKRFDVSKSMGRSVEALRIELDKCVVRCSNCHRIKTFEDRQVAQDKRRIKNANVI